VIESAYAGTQGGFAFWALVIAALFTSFYSWRLMFMTFWGTPRGDKHTHEHAHESPVVMLVPLGVLAVGSIFAGMVWYGSFFGDHNQVNRFFGIPAHHAEADAGHGEEKALGDDAGHGEETDSHAAADTGHSDEAAHGAEGDHAMAAGVAPEGAIFMHPDNHVMDEAHHAPKWVKVSPFVAMLIGFITAWVFYIKDPSIPRRLAENQRPLYQFLLNKWYFDEIYDFLFVRPAKALANLLWKRGDGDVIDGGLNGVAMGIIPFFTRLAGRAQSGYIFTYAFAMVVGIAILVTWMTVFGGAE